MLAQARMNKEKGTPGYSYYYWGVNKKKGGITANVHTPPPTKRKNAPVEVTTEDPKGIDRHRKLCLSLT